MAKIKNSKPKREKENMEEKRQRRHTSCRGGGR